MNDPHAPVNPPRPQQDTTQVTDDNGCQVPVFDRAGLLARLMDDASLMHTVTQGFVQDIPHQIAALRTFLANADAKGAERQAHTIKGASANVGGERLRQTAYLIEQAARAGDLHTASSLLPNLESAFAQLRQAMYLPI
jgi:HPt (histidine-containing phosphotransfer) domain-containing protein